MGSDEIISGRCGAKTNDGSYCKRYPRKGSNFCYMHDPEQGDGQGSSPVHAVESNRSEYYQNLTGEEQALIDAYVDSLLKGAPFDKSDTAKMEIVYQAAISMHQAREANKYIQDEGLAQDQVTYDDKGNPQEITEENVLALTKSRLSRDVLKALKELGTLDSPDDRAADAQKSIAEILSGES